MAKEQAMQEYVTKTLQEYTKKEDTEILNDMERLAKASYVQQRKTNTYLSAQAEQLVKALKKTIKILINYDRKKEEEAAQQAEQMQKELEMQAALQAQKEPDHTALVLGGVWQAGRRCTGSGCPVTAGDSPAYCIA